MKIRINSLDYLRGIMALSIMLYHYSSWSFHTYHSGSILGKLGIYGVSFFYILSGLTLYIVYNETMATSHQITQFFIKRLFRIYPLLWLTTLLYVIVPSVKADAYTIFLNLSGLFGFIKPTAAIGVGVWSIGNELVFYAFFPLIILYEKKDSKLLFYIIIFLSFLVALVFAFIVLRNDVNLEFQWAYYVNPFNQLFLFTGGILIGHLSKELKPSVSKRILAPIIIVLAILFTLVPAEGDLIHIVVAWNRIIFALICLLLCAGVFWLRLSYYTWLHQVLSFLGEASYSIYLLHPIVYSFLKTLNNKFNLLNSVTVFFLGIFLTLFASFITYRLFEKPMMSLGKRLTSRIAASGGPLKN